PVLAAVKGMSGRQTSEPYPKIHMSAPCGGRVGFLLYADGEAPSRSDPMREDPKALLDELDRLWSMEREATHERFVAERKDTPLSERVERGIAMKDLAVEECTPAAGRRVVLWLSSRGGEDLDDLRI